MILGLNRILFDVRFQSIHEGQYDNILYWGDDAALWFQLFIHRKLRNELHALPVSSRILTVQ